MEDQIAELTARLSEIEASASVTNTIFAETYYYLSIPLMVLIHAGFLAYEMGASRMKNVLSSGVKNILAFAFVIPTFWFFWVVGLLGLSNRIIIVNGTNGNFGSRICKCYRLGLGRVSAIHGSKYC